jgi:cytoskeletal protein CcmA (bactofilin family)
MDSAAPVEITALLGRGTRFEGKLFFQGRVRIDGAFRGEIRSDDVLVVGEGAEIDAEIDVATVIVRGGIVRGNIRARTAIELYVPARVVGNLHSPSIFIDKGVKVEGSCTMSPLPEPEPGAGDVRPAGA